jgi:hypothetical protein
LLPRHHNGKLGRILPFPDTIERALGKVARPKALSASAYLNARGSI